MQVSAHAGGLDVLVNVAGGFKWQPLMDGTHEVWEAMFTMNLKTAVIVCRAALPHLASGGAGRIINIGAGAAARAAAGMGAYTASKAGVERLTESLAEELKERHITVNAVLPGTLDTARNRADMPERGLQPLGGARGRGRGGGLSCLGRGARGERGGHPGVRHRLRSRLRARGLQRMTRTR